MSKNFCVAIAFALAIGGVAEILPAERKEPSADAHAVFVERRAALLKEFESKLSDELSEALFNIWGNGGWLTLGSSAVVEELIRLPHLAGRISHVRVGSRALPAFAATIRCWQHLKGIKLNFCNLVEIPDWALRLPALTHLGLFGNEGISIPDTVTFPFLLQVVELDGCELSCIPAGLARLRFLKKVGLSFNPRELALPAWLAKRLERGEIEVRGLWF